jgi:uncharacterized protein involved in exopolysaccharide biosynthesis
MQTTQPATQPYDDEIGLLELWQILVKRKALIMACCVLCLAGGAAFEFLKAPTYEASVKLRIDHVKGESALRRPVADPARGAASVADESHSTGEEDGCG